MPGRILTSCMSLTVLSTALLTAGPARAGGPAVGMNAIITARPGVGVPFYSGHGLRPAYTNFGFGYAPYLSAPFYAGAGLSPYYPNYGFGYAPYLATPGYFGGPYAATPYAYQPPPPPPATVLPPVAPEEAVMPRPQDGVARVSLRVPEDAEVWIEGVKMRQTGERRHFVTPPLKSGKAYEYEIRVAWTENGRPAAETQRLAVHAGDRASLAVLALPGDVKQDGAQAQK